MSIKKKKSVNDDETYEKNSYLSIVSEGHGVMRATCHFCHFLALEVRGDQHRGQPLVCRPNPHLTVAIVTPRKQLSVCSNSTQR